MKWIVPVKVTRRPMLPLLGTFLFVSHCLFAVSGNTSEAQSKSPSKVHASRGDWPQLCGSPSRNNATEGKNIPTEWDIETGKNIKWCSRLGFNTFGNIVVANGKVYVGTNNSAGYLKRYPRTFDLCVLLCFRESNGEFLWQYSQEKFPGGNAYDWPQTGLYSAPAVEGDRLWFVTNRGEVVCLDTEGFQDNQNDGPFISEKPNSPTVDWDKEAEADIIWKFDMMKELGVRQHYRATCAPTIWGDLLFVCTSNGTHSDHLTITAPDAPSFMALDKYTGKVLWTDNSPGKNILRTQTSSPSVGVLGGVVQAIFPGGDGWLYSFRADRWAEGKPELLWKFDGNPKDSTYVFDGRSTRNGIAAVPVIYDGLVYLAMGEDPDNGEILSNSEGPGHLWCINPTKRGDVSPDLVVDQHGNVVPHQRIQATRPIGDLRPTVAPNVNSAVVWHYDRYDQNGDGKIETNEAMHRTIGSPVIKSNLLFIADIAGIVHCLNAKTGKPFWTYDISAACLATPLIVGENVYVSDAEGDVTIFSLSTETKLPEHEINMVNTIWTMPVVANNVLYIATKGAIFAIAQDGHQRTER